MKEEQEESYITVLSCWRKTLHLDNSPSFSNTGHRALSKNLIIMHDSLYLDAENELVRCIHFSIDIFSDFSVLVY